MSDGLVRPEDWDDPVQLPDVGTVRRVLVPFDGSHHAERALAWAALAAAAAEAEVVVMVAYEPPLTKKGRGGTYVEAIRDALDDEAKALAAEAVELLSAAGCRARGVVIRGEAAAATLETFETDDCDLVVLGRRGLSSELAGIAGTLERFRSSLQGGVAEKVARHADVAVMVV